MRLQKYLAQAGVGSRRKCEEYIKAGRVSVDGRVVREMGVDVADDARVSFDGEAVRLQKRMRYIMLNKPMGVVTTLSDPQGRETVVDLIQDISERIYPVGRLDYDTEGLLLLTNDGELANRLTHPRYNIEKQYRAKISGTLSEGDVDKLKAGVRLDDGHKCAPCKVHLSEKDANTSVYTVVIHEGHNRLVRRMFEAVGKRVFALKREKIGNLSLGGLPVGRWRHLSDSEVAYLKRITGSNN